MPEPGRTRRARTRPSRPKSLSASAGPAFEALHCDQDIAVVLTDLAMLGRDGLELMTTAQSKIGRELEFIVLTGHRGKDEAIGALRNHRPCKCMKQARWKQFDNWDTN